MLELVQFGKLSLDQLEPMFLLVPDGETSSSKSSNPNVTIVESVIEGELVFQQLLENPTLSLPPEKGYLKKIEKSLYQDGTRELKEGVHKLIGVSRRYLDNGGSFQINPRQPLFLDRAPLTMQGGVVVDPGSTGSLTPWPVEPLEVELVEHEPEERAFELLIKGGGAFTDATTHTIAVHETSVWQIKEISVFETDIDDDGDLDYIFGFFDDNQAIIGGAIYVNRPVASRPYEEKTDSLEFKNQ